MERIVVVGGDAAGMSAAAQAARSGAAVVVFERGAHTSYAACGLPYFLGGVVGDVGALIARTPEQHRANGIDVRLRHEVVAIDLERRSVVVRRLDDGSQIEERFDQLVLATGGLSAMPDLENINAGGIFSVRTIPNALAIDTALRERDAHHAVVVGAGHIGLEMAEAFLLRGLTVRVIDASHHPVPTVDDDIGALIADKVRDAGIDLRLGVPATGFGAGPDGWISTVRTDNDELAADIVVLALGVRPNVGLAAAAGIAIGPTGGITTDGRMATSAHGVWAAGDCVETHHRLTGRPVTVALGTHANKQGRVVGINLCGGDAVFPGVIGTEVTKFRDTEIARTGLSEAEAREAGFSTLTATIEAGARAEYYPGNASMSVKVVAEAESGRLLGAQIVGGEDSAKRIDALAVGIWNHMTAEEFEQLDLAYAPPFAPVWDAVLVAARKVAELV